MGTKRVSRKILSTWVIFLLIMQTFAGALFLFPRFFGIEKAHALTQTNNPSANTGTAWTNPANAYADGTNYANITSGSPSGSNVWGNYGFSLTGSTITQVRVRYDAYSAGVAGTPASQTARPTGDDADTASSTKSTGTTFFGVVDETSASDADYYTMVTNGGGHVTMTFPAFTVPAGSVISDLTVYYRATNGGAANIRSTIKVGTTYHDTVDPGNDPSTWTTYNYAYTTNPATGAAWTPDEINGTDTEPTHNLNAFGTSSSDCNPDNQISWVYAVVNYTSATEYDDQIKVDVSWDGGTSWSATQDTTLTGAETTTWYDVTGATAWTPEKLADGQLQVRVLAQTVNSAEAARLDWLPVEVTSTAAPDVPTLVSPANGSSTNDDTPTLSANYSDSDIGDTGTTNYRIASTNATDCLNNASVVASGASAETATTDENTTWTPASSIGIDGTYYWCAQNNDGSLTSAWTSMGNFILDTTAPSVTGITSVAGDPSAIYYDNTDDNSTAVVFTSSADAQTCKWNSTDVAYDSMSNTCASTSGCTLNLSGNGAKTIYVRCMDQVGNKTASSYALEYTIDSSAPSGGSMTYTDGYYTSASVNLTASDGTDAPAGIDAATRTVQRKSATLSGGTCGSYGSFETITPAGSYPDYTDATVASGNCYQYQYLVSDNAGNQGTFAGSNTAKIDTADPSGGSITYADGVYNIASVSLTASDGTDPLSGINVATRTVQRKSATYTDSACGAFGSFETIAPSGSYPDYTDTTVSSDNCYQYQYLVSDNAGNQAAYTSSNTVKVEILDATPPSGGSIVYTDGDYTSASVSLTTDDGTDPETGIDAATRTVQRKSATLTGGVCGSYGSFATIAPTGTYPNFTDATVESSNCYQYQYLVSNTAALQATYISTNVAKVDAAAPSGGSIAYTDGYATNVSVSLTASDGTDAGNGINAATRIVQRKSATLSGGACGSFGEFATITPSGSYPDFTDTATSGNCYQYQYLVSDNIGNQATYASSNIIKIDTAPPSGGSLAYTDGYDSDGSVSLTAADGTDSVSGINTGSRTMQRKEAALSSGVCGSYGSFAAITPTGAYPNFTDTTIVSDKCYQYQYLVSDNAGNQTTYASINTVKVDTAGPTGAGVSSIAVDSKTQLTVTASIPTDGPSGLHAAPYWFEETTNGSGGSDSADWQASNVFVDSGLSANTQYTYRVKAQDNASNESAFSSTLSKYTLADQVTGVSASDASTAGEYKINLAWTDQGQSGIKIEQDTACDGYETTVYDNASSNPTSPISVTVSANTCYRFRISSYNGDGSPNTQDAAPQSSQLTTPPAQPTGLTHTANTTSSITWDWSDVSEATGYKIYRTDDDVLLQTIGTATSQWIQDSLSSDTQYSIYARATNANGEGISSLSASAYTSADAPTTPAHSANTTDSITWSWASGGSQKDFYAWTETPAANSDWIVGTSWLQNSLSANSLYQFFAKARNEENDETGSVTASNYTSQNAPAGISFGAVSANSITLSAEGSLPNLSGNSSGLYFINNTLAQNSGWIQANSWNNSSLSPNTQYAYQVKARNGDADESSYATEETKYTLANTPGTPTLSEADYNTMNLVLISNSNPAATEFAIYETSTGDYVDSDGSLDQASAQWQTYAAWGGASGITVTGLSPNLTYTFKVKARNGENVETALGTSASLATLQMPVPPNTPALVSPADTSYTNDTAPTLIARYSDNNLDDTGTTNYRLSSSGLSDCTNNLNIIGSGTSPETATNDENTSWTVAPLLSSDQIYYWCAQNNDGTDTSAWTGMGSFSLDTQSPSGAALSLSGVTATSITAQVSGAADDGSGLDALPYYFLNGGKPDNSGWQSSASWTSASLIPNTAYDFRVKTRDAIGNESDYTIAQAYRTLAGLPTDFALAANTTSRITASWTANSNPAGTEYYVENITGGTNSGWITATSWASSGLAANTSYTFRMKARNLAETETAWTAETSRTTLSLAPLVVADSDDNDNDDDDDDSDEVNTAIRQFVSDMPYYVSNLPDEIDATLSQKEEESLAPKIAPLAMQGAWTLLPAQPLTEFLSAYPEDIKVAAAGFPEFEEIFLTLNAPNLEEMEPVEDFELILPGLNRLALRKTERSDFYPSVPLSKFSAGMKNKIPSEIIFARAGDGTIDLPVNISPDEESGSIQKITAVSGKTIRLAVKPQGKVSSVKGYLLLKNSAGPSADNRQTGSPLDQNWTANWKSAFDNLIYPSYALADETRSIQTRMMLSEFEYSDPDGDGIFEAEIEAPAPEGQYEVVTIINYADRKLGQKELRLIAVVDPEGYVFRKIEDEELRVRNAAVSLYHFDGNTGSFELWPAEKYQQTNPQTTDATGRYSFLVPAGKYRLKVEAPGCRDYSGEEFFVTEGEGIHQNIELQKGSGIFDYLDTEGLIIFLMASTLGINWWRGRKKIN